MALYFCEVIRLEDKGKAGVVCCQPLKGKALPRCIQQKSSAVESTLEFSRRFDCFGLSQTTAQTFAWDLRCSLLSGPYCRWISLSDFFHLLGETSKFYFFIEPHLHCPRGLAPPHPPGSFFFFLFCPLML